MQRAATIVRSVVCWVLWSVGSLGWGQGVPEYAVRVSATAQASPPRVQLTWLADSRAVSYTLVRKSRDDPYWGAGVALGTATNYTDSNVVAGGAYEYRIRKAASTYSAEGEIFVGIQAPLTDVRGKVILIVDSTYAADLACELGRLQQDLTGDGWTVLRHDVARTAAVTNIKALILGDYAADPAGVKSVFLLGHVAVPYSGDLAPDGHPEHMGAWPADAYYGDVGSVWTDTSVNSTAASSSRNRNVPGDGKFDSSDLPGPVALEVGRVDMAGLPAFAQSERELLRRYLNKDHAFRHHWEPADRRALIDDHFGVMSGEAFAANGYRVFSALVGASNTVAGDWLPTLLGGQSYLWGYGCGPGSYTSAADIATSAELAGCDPQVVFGMYFGSYFGDWDSSDNLLRASLATPSRTLAAVWAGRPYWVFHHMGLGETLGFCARVTQNNYGTYMANSFVASVHMALMGDPTLRMHPVAPPGFLRVSSNGVFGVHLAWNPSADPAVLGYHVYSAPVLAGPFTRLTASVLVATNLSLAQGATNIFMVRAVKLESTSSGSYTNASQGVYQSLDGAAGALAVSLDTSLAGAFLTEPALIPLQAVATDPAASVVRVEFYSGGVKLGEDALPPYALVWSNAPAGVYSVTARAVAASGLWATSSPVEIHVGAALSGAGAVWKYLDTGAAPGAGWQSAGYDDSLWAAGPAKLGYSNAAATTVSYGGDPSNKHITTYFRRAFTVASPGLYTNLALGVLRDDAAAVYLNGVEVYRGNLPGGALAAATLASGAASAADETNYFRASLSPALLAAGTNVLAVEVHLGASNSPAMGFDLFLAGAVKPLLTISAQNTQAVYGAAIPALRPLYSGFLNGDTPASLSSLPLLSTAAGAGSPAGAYPISVTGAVSTVYALEYVTGVLSILPAAVAGSLVTSANPAPQSAPPAWTLSLAAVAPGAGTPSGSVQFKIDGASNGPPEALALGVAVHSAALAVGTHVVTAEYSGDGNFLGTTTTLAPDQVIAVFNAPPVAGADTLLRHLPGGVKTAIATLLANDTDPDGDPVEFVGVSAASARGGQVTHLGSWILYTALPGDTNADSFTYTIRDGRGGWATGAVSVGISTNEIWPPNLTALSAGGGVICISGDGLPGCAYQIQYAEDLVSPVWQWLGESVADEYGVFVIQDAPGAGQRFYRSVFP